MELQDCRKEVKEFAIAMEIKLRENDHKGGWQDMSNEEIVSRILEETAEVIMNLACISGNSPDNEAIDVANFAMFLWDNITRQCGRE
jgi:hypothetical protein